MVNLTFSCELDEVPYEAGRLTEDLCVKLTSIVEDLKEASTHLLTTDQELQFGEAYAAILNAKQAFVKYDERLSGVLTILSGFYRAKTEPQELINDARETAEATSEISDKLAELESQLEQAAAEVVVEEHDDE